MSHNWRQNNTGRTGFGQTSCMKDNPAESDMNYEPTKTESARSRVKKKEKKKPNKQENRDALLFWSGSD